MCEPIPVIIKVIYSTILISKLPVQVYKDKCGIWRVKLGKSHWIDSSL